MAINMEVKKDAMRQTQDGLWKLTITVHPNDMPMQLLQAPMGTVYGIAMIPIDHDNSETNTTQESKVSQEKTEGEKLRIQAVMLCKDKEFQKYALSQSFGRQGYDPSEDIAREYIIDYCGINSRSKIANNINAQDKCKRLFDNYKKWQVERQYKENLNRSK